MAQVQGENLPMSLMHPLLLQLPQTPLDAQSLELQIPLVSLPIPSHGLPLLPTELQLW